MSLSQQITDLRSAKGLSQSDLAEALGVSRQSVSKWETGASVPSLDKLVEMSKLFSVTLDELVKGETGEKPEAPEQAVTEVRYVERPVERRETPRTWGVILLIVAAILGLFFMLVTGSVFGLVMGLPFLVCGLVCMVAKRHPGLWCAWAVLLMVDAYFHYATGLSWSAVFLTFQWTWKMNYTRLAIAWVMLLWRLIMIALTAWRLKDEGDTTKKKLLLLLGALVVLHIPIRLKPDQSTGYYEFWGSLSFAIGWAKLWLATLLATHALRCRRLTKQ